MTQCNATTSVGGRCKRQSLEDSYFCPYHQNTPEPPTSVQWEADSRVPVLGLPAEAVDNMLQYLREGYYPTKDDTVKERRAFARRLSDNELIHVWLGQNNYATCGQEQCSLCNAQPTIRPVPSGRA